MLHAVRGENADLPRVEVDWHGDDDRAFRVAEPLGDPRRDVGVVERAFQLRERGSPERRIPLERRRFFDRGHGRGV